MITVKIFRLLKFFNSVLVEVAGRSVYDWAYRRNFSRNAHSHSCDRHISWDEYHQAGNNAKFGNEPIRPIARHEKTNDEPTDVAANEAKANFHIFGQINFVPSQESLDETSR